MRIILVLLLAIKLNCQSTFNYTFAQQNLAVNDYGLTWSISHSYMFVIFSAIESTVVTTIIILIVSLNYTFTGELPFLLSFDQNIAIMTRNTSLLSSGRFLILSSSLTLVQSVPFTGYDFATSVFNYDFDSNCILRG